MAPNYALSFLCQVPFKYILGDLNAIVICTKPRLMKSWLSVEWLVTFGKPCADLITVLTALCDDLRSWLNAVSTSCLFCFIYRLGKPPMFLKFCVLVFTLQPLSSLRTDGNLCCTLCQIQTPWWIDSVLLISIQFCFLQSHSYCPLKLVFSFLLCALEHGFQSLHLFHHL